MTPARKNGLVLLKLEAFGDQSVHPAGAPHHVKYCVTCHTLEMVVVVRPVSKFKPLWPARQINGDQTSVIHPFVQQAIDGCQADACVSKPRIHIGRRQGARSRAEHAV